MKILKNPIRFGLKLSLAVASLGLAAIPASLAAEPVRPVLDQSQPQEPPEQMLEDGAKQILKALELMLKAIPRYAPPEVLPNGDIIIRRLPSDPDGEAPTPPGDDDPIRTLDGHLKT